MVSLKGFVLLAWISFGLGSVLYADIQQEFFIEEDFHYLNVPRAGTYAMYDMLECTQKCLRNPSCLSLNVAAYKGDDERFWCELLFLNKDSNPKEYRENGSSHHLYIDLESQSPCVFSPCKNRGTCVPNYRSGTFECKCKGGFFGKYCESAAHSCDDQHNILKSNMSHLVTLILDSKPTSVLCHMGDFGCGGGGWTPIMKIDGNKSTFHYNSSLWSNKETFNLAGGETGFDTKETKLPTYWNTSFSKICLGMKVDGQDNFVVMHKQASSLYSLIADGKYRATSLGRDTWKRLLGSEASLQINCNKEGFNALSGQRVNSKARIGILGNNENDCSNCDSRIGFGTGGDHDDSNTCGNEATHSGDNGDKHNKTTGYILVQ